MEIRTLRYFLAIAQEKTIVQAAKQLHITQPTLSRQMKELEEEFDKQLFIRTNRNIILTEEGLLLKSQAQRILFLVDKTEQMMKSDLNVLAGQIHIGASETTATKLIAKAIGLIQAKHPQLHFNLYSGNAQDISDRLESGMLDFGLVIDPVNLARFDFLKLPTHDNWGLLMKKDDPLAERPHLKAADLYFLKIYCSNQEMVKNEIAGWLGGNYRGLKIVGTYNLLYNATLLVEQGTGYVLCLDNGPSQIGSNLAFVPLYPNLQANHYLIYKKYQMFTKECEYFLEVFQSILNEYHEN